MSLHFLKSSLSKKYGNKYKSGPSIKSVLYNLLEVVWEIEMKPDLIVNISPYQIGTKPDHRAQENLVDLVYILQFVGMFFLSY